MISYLWTLDNYLAVLFLCGFLIYLALCVIGWLFDQTIHYMIKAWRGCKKLKQYISDMSFFAMDP